MKYFVVSDLHSFATFAKESLAKAGFDINNPEHVLIICGDIFDRGDETLEIYDFINSIPASRRVLVRGNHESLYLDLLKKNFPHDHDFHNGTVHTFCQIANIPDDYLSFEYWFYEDFKGDFKNYDAIYNGVTKKLKEYWNKVKKAVAQSPITKFIQSNEWVDFYEVDKYVFVHSFIPVLDESGLPWYKQFGHEYKYDPNWRDSKNWEAAIWGCPYEMFDTGLFNPEIEKGKVLVCGHWHASDFHKVYEHDNGCNFNLYYGKNLIAIDGCTAASDQVNVLVIDLEQNKCFDQNGELHFKDASK